AAVVGFLGLEVRVSVCRVQPVDDLLNQTFQIRARQRRNEGKCYVGGEPCGPPSDADMQRAHCSTCTARLTVWMVNHDTARQVPQPISVMRLAGSERGALMLPPLPSRRERRSGLQPIGGLGRVPAP